MGDCETPNGAKCMIWELWDHDGSQVFPPDRSDVEKKTSPEFDRKNDRMLERLFKRQIKEVEERRTLRKKKKS